MLAHLPPLLRGIVTSTLLGLNTLIGVALMVPPALAKLLVPVTSVRNACTRLLNAMMASVSKLSDAASKHDFGSTEDHMQHCAGTIRRLMDEVRQSADALEAEIGDEFWPLPTYQEMLFIK